MEVEPSELLLLASVSSPPLPSPRDTEVMIPPDVLLDVALEPSSPVLPLSPSQ